jgi:hypothetical protein
MHLEPPQTHFYTILVDESMSPVSSFFKEGRFLPCPSVNSGNKGGVRGLRNGPREGLFILAIMYIVLGVKTWLVTGPAVSSSVSPDVQANTIADRSPRDVLAVIPDLCSIRPTGERLSAYPQDSSRRSAFPRTSQDLPISGSLGFAFLPPVPTMPPWIRKWLCPVRLWRS